MGKAELPRINEVTAFLKQYEPETLEGLKASGGGLSAALEPGVLGGAAEKVDDQSLRSGLAAQADVLAASLSKAIGRAQGAVERISDRLMRARRYRFLAEVLATVGASGVIGTALLDQRVATLVAGFLTLGSSLFALFATRVVLGSDAREAELAALAKRLAKASGSAELTQNLLKAMLPGTFDVEQMQALIKESNALFGELNDALSAADL